MDAEYSRGQRLYVETNTHNLEGIFYSMDTGHDVITLTDVVLHPSEEKKEGFCHFHRGEVMYGKFYVNIYSYICEVPDFPLAVMVRILRHLQYTVKYFNSECMGPKIRL